MVQMRPRSVTAPSSGVDTFLRGKEVARVTGIPRATRYEMIAAGTFPAPVKLSKRIVVWAASEIRKWQQARLAERDAKLAEGGSHAPAA
jgi:prophage regulatory protein